MSRTTTSAAAPLPRLALRPVGVVLAAGGLGVATQGLFYGVGIGLNVPLALALVLAAAWALRRPGTMPRLRDAWLPAAGLGLAVFVSLRGDTTLVVLDALGAVALVGYAVASLSGAGVVDRSVAGLARLGALLIGSAAAGVLDPLVRVRQQVPVARLASPGSRFRAVLRGLLIALPLVLVFGALFSSADAVFRRLAEGLVRWKLDLGTLPGRITVALIGAWLTGGLLALVASGAARGLADQPTRPDRPRLGDAELVTVLVVLDLLFGAFAVLQAAYLFGGQDTINASGLTYAEYAQRGFFELLAAAFLVGGLILGMESVVERRGRAYLAAIICLVCLTGVVLASAFLRLRLYQDAYGWTELRFYVLAAICWLGIGAAGGVVALASNRTRWLLHGMLALSIGFGFAFNLIGPVRLIAEQNVARAVHPEQVAPGGETGLDAAYLAGLGTDAVIVLAEARPDLPPAVRAEVSRWLEAQAAGALQAPSGWQAWNLSRERARAELVR